MAISLLPNTVTGTITGDWVFIGPGQKVDSVNFEVVTTATVKLQGTNDPRAITEPTSVVAHDITSGDTTDAGYFVDGGFDYVRANVTAWTAGDVNAWIKVISQQ